MGLHDWYDQKKGHYQAWKKRLVKQTAEEDGMQKVLGSEWNELGYHRTIAGFFYTIGLLVPSTLFGILLLPLLEFTEMRSPMIAGYQAAAAMVFGFVYAIMDLNLGDTIDRFIPEYLIKDPRKAMQYASFFVKYQMWSGLIQIALVPILCQTYIIDKTIFAYLAWYLIFISIQQYPATLGFFQNLLDTFQRYNKANMVVFWRANFIEPITKLAGGVIGLFWGQANPAFGELYGMVLGIAIGGYVDDFFTFALGTYWLSKILDQYGISIRELYGQKIPREVWGSALGFASRTWPSMIFGTVMGFTGFLIVVDNLPGYVTITGLTKQAQNLAKFSGWSGNIMGTSRPVYSEAYNNGKRDLVKYYIASGYKYWSFFWFFLGLFNIFATPIIIQIIFGNFVPNEPQWFLIAPMIPVYVIMGIWSPFNDISEKMILIGNHPEVNTVLGIIGTFVNLFFTWYFIVVLNMGWLGLVMIGVPWTLVAMVIRYIYMQRKILHLEWAFWKDIAWQVFLAPAIAGFTFVAFQMFVLLVIWPWISAGLFGMEVIGPTIAVLAMLIGGLMVIYVPLYAWLGGWDDQTMRDFKKSVPLSGPSLFIVYPMYKLFLKCYNKSPFKKRAKMQIGDRAFQELLDLGRERLAHQAAVEK